MKINPYFSSISLAKPLIFDRASKIKEKIHNATDAFIRFCSNESIWHFLEKDRDGLLQPYLQRINALCLSETDPDLVEVYYKSISTILEKRLPLVKLYISVVHDVKIPRLNLDIIHWIASSYPELLETHLQVIQELKNFNPQLLETYLKMAKERKSNALTQYVCGAYTSYGILKKNAFIHDIFFKILKNIENSKPALIENYLQSIANLCSCKPLLLESYLTLTYSLDSLTLEIYLNNIHDMQPSLFEDYIHIASHLKANPSVLKLYLQSICTVKKDLHLLKMHQHNTKTICEFVSHILETYLKTIPWIDLLHLGPHLQNIQKLDLTPLMNYIQTVHDIKCDLLAHTVYHMHNTIHISGLQPKLLDLYHAPFQKWGNSQEKIVMHSYNTYCITQKHNDLLEDFLEIALLLEDNQPHLSGLHLENVNTHSHRPDFLRTYISAVIKEVKKNEEPSLLFYIIYNTSFMQKKYAELEDLYQESYQVLDKDQEDTFCHVSNTYHISQSYPGLLKDYLETVVFLQKSVEFRLLWPYLQNIKNLYTSTGNPEYILHVSNVKHNQELLIISICNIFNIHRIKQQHPKLLQIYELTYAALENTTAHSCHVYNTFHVSIMFREHLESYLETVRIASIWKSQDSTDPKWLWLNTRLQSIKDCSFKNFHTFTTLLKLISQIDIIFAGKYFLIEEIVKNMEEKDKEQFSSISIEIIPYVIAKTIFLYAFNATHVSLNPMLFPLRVQQKIVDFCKKPFTHDEKKKLKEILHNLDGFTHYLNQETPEDNIRALVKEVHELWTHAIQGENNLFMLSWQEAVLALSLA